MANPLAGLRQRTRDALVELGAAPQRHDARALPVFADAVALVTVQVDADGRVHQLTAEAAAAWQILRAAARADDVTLHIVSAFRSFDRQMELIRTAIKQGRQIEDVLANVAPPGCSEHHTGRAVDVGTPGCEPVTEAFAGTEAFAWLSAHANRHDFRMSFPTKNRWGFAYEPWHWCFGGA